MKIEERGENWTFNFFVEETVLEIKRQSMLDLQKAVSQSEQKSTKLLIREREQFQRLNHEFKAQTFEEAYALLNRQDDGPEVRKTSFVHKKRKSERLVSFSNVGIVVEKLLKHVQDVI